MFFDTSRFAFIESLEADWRAIRAEAQALEAESYLAWPEHDLYGKTGWDVFGLYAFHRRLDDNCTRCPKTTSLVEKIPGLAMAGFSCLGAGAHIKPHCGFEGYSGYYLRCHLGLEVPAGGALRVGNETREWRPGRCLVFDDSFEHEAWNRGDAPRTVLLIDFTNPFRAAPPPAARLTAEVVAMLKRETPL